MDFYTTARRRRMVRNYTDEAVDPAVLERIVDIAQRAPSAGFSQGQSLVVVTEASTRRSIAAIADEEAYTSQGFDPWISRAPVHIVVCISEETYHARYREPDKLSPDGEEITWAVPYWWVDAGASMMLILLAAVAEGLAAGFLGSHTMPQLKELLGIPDAVAPIGVITLGHGAPDRRSGSLGRGRKPSAKVVHREKW